MPRSLSEAEVPTIRYSNYSFNANVAIIVQFKAGGGLDEIAFQGMGQFFAPLNFKLKPVKLFGPPPSGTYGTDPPKMSCNVDLRYNFSQKTFHGKLQVFIDADGAVVGEGTAEVLVAPKKWYIYLGTPQVPIRVRFLVGNTVLSETRAYFDFGNELPPLPDLPSQFRGDAGGGSLLGSALRSRAGGGIIMGFSFFQDLGLKEGSKSPVYAYFTIDLGTDMGLVDFGDTYCGNTGRKIGINGWYATGRAYAFVKAEVGILFKKQPIPIASLAVAAALQAELPNPFVATGVIGGRYKLLGGLVKGKFSFKFQLGEACELDCADCPVDGQEQKVEVITALSPGANEEGVSPFTAPKAEFIGTLGGTINLYDDEGNPIDYRIELESVKLSKADATEVFCRQILSNDGRELLYQPFEVLPANTPLTFTVKVKLYRNGQYLESQEKSVSFTTGVLPANIAAENIAASYPIDGMQNFYRDEVASGRGFLTLQYGRNDLFSNGSQVEVVFLNAAGAKIASTPAEYLAYEQRINFAIPSAQLAGEQNYTLQLVQKQAGKEFTLCALRFRTSRYTKFWDKVESFRQSATQSQNGLNVVLSAETGAEAFDALELGKLIQVEAALAGNAWYEAQIRRHERWRNEANLSIAQRPDVPLEKTVYFSSGTTLEYGAFAAAKSDFDELKAQAQQLVQAENEYCSQLHASSGCEQSGGCVTCPENPNSTLYEAAAANWVNVPTGAYPVRFLYSIPGMRETTARSLNLQLTGVSNVQTVRVSK